MATRDNAKDLNTNNIPGLLVKTRNGFIVLTILKLLIDTAPNAININSNVDVITIAKST